MITIATTESERSGVDSRSLRPTPAPGKRAVDLVVISDTHLGARSSRAEELLAYLKSIQPRELILNGDIVDIWEFDKGFWPEAHMKVARRILKFAASGIPVRYVIGNHDQALRAYAPFQLGGIELVDEMVREIEGKRTWFVHGDRLEAAMSTPRWLSLLGTWSYDVVIAVNSLVNRLREACGFAKVSFAQQIKLRVRGAREHIRRYEETCARIASERGYDAVVTGHIHQARILRSDRARGPMTYLNSGDWVESMSALEFHAGEWSLVSWDATAKRPCASEADDIADAPVAGQWAARSPA